VRQFNDDARHADRTAWAGGRSVTVRRRSPILLLVVLLITVSAPVGVVMATGLEDGTAGDEVETAQGSGGAGGDEAEGDGSSQGQGARPGDRRAATSSSTAAPTTTSAPTTTMPPPTAPPTTAPPTTPAPTAPPATAPPATAPPATPSPPVPAPGAQVVDLVNAARADAGCGALRVDDRLVAAAQAHSDDMAAQDYFSHTSLDGRSFADRVLAAGYPSPGGENIAQGQQGAQAVHDAWMNSEGHRANILNCAFTAIGVGLHADTWTWTQNFGY
jgi:uncharacterized protein YkwD